MSPTTKKTSSRAAKSVGKASIGNRTEPHDDSGGESQAGRSLIIVESPTKARTLSKYLGAPFIVKASGGHVRDLPEKELGVDLTRNFEPVYQALASKKKIIDELSSLASKAKRVILATDPDREGEAIAWHITHILKLKSLKDIQRVQFHEITRSAVKAALASPGHIDIQKVDAQQARRIMDRLVGYQVSPLLWKTVTGGLSAGRVQSVALRLLCEREAEINAFKAVEYWTIDGKFSGDSVDPFLARLFKLDGKKVELENAKLTELSVQRLKKFAYHVADIKRTRRKKTPPPPFITSTLQQEASRRLGFPVKRTMSVAQKLYEGIELGDKGFVGLITYMRTDSLRTSSESVEAARSYIASEFGSDYVAPSPRYYKNKKSTVQDAHEAIRPTDVRLSPESLKTYLSPEEYKLYDLIWRQFVSTQMIDAEFDVTTVTIFGGSEAEFRATGQIIAKEGFLILHKSKKKKTEDKEEQTDTNNEEENLISIPANLVVGMSLKLLDLKSEQHFTQPPPRFTEATLVKELDEKGIGRPSTYATIISTLLDRTYAEKREKNLFPTDLGNTVNSILVSRFPEVFSIEFTAKMEDELDRIEDGVGWKTVLSDFYNPFKIALDSALEMKKELKKITLQTVGRACPTCGRDLVYRFGKRGKFISCSGFPECKYAENSNGEAPVMVEEKCPNCGLPLMKRNGRFGPFLGCSGYPKCKTIVQISSSHKCPKEGCDGTISERRTKKGKIFYGCSKYPECDFVSWDPPVDGPCPQCGAPTLLQKSTKNGEIVKCFRCNWVKP